MVPGTVDCSRSRAREWDVADEKQPVEKAVELFVYAPVGMALYVRDMLPSMMGVFVVAGQARGAVASPRPCTRAAHAVPPVPPEVKRRIDESVGVANVRGRRRVRRRARGRGQRHRRRARGRRQRARAVPRNARQRHADAPRRPRHASPTRCRTSGGSRVRARPARRHRRRPTPRGTTDVAVGGGAARSPTTTSCRRRRWSSGSRASTASRSTRSVATRPSTAAATPSWARSHSSADVEVEPAGGGRGHPARRRARRADRGPSWRRCGAARSGSSARHGPSRSTTRTTRCSRATTRSLVVGTIDDAVIGLRRGAWSSSCARARASAW